MAETVSIVTVTYNSEKTLEITMESVLTQTYDRIEYLIIDGASSDGTVSLAESYRERMEQKGICLRIVSEPDSGIYDAMNKGIQLAEGDIIGILNSNDWYEPDTVETVVKEFAQENCDLLFANIRMHKRDGSSFVKKARIRSFQTSRDWNHPTMFVRADVYKSHPFRNKGIHDDYGCYLQIAKEGYRMITLDKVLANFRMGGVSNHKSLKEAVQRIKDRYRWCYRVNGYSRWYLLECIAIEAAKMLLG
ncbi:MAG: glycosyltransferase [Lachnospiraceae bacterium]|nr:glycosyltransferase [Lachnospiraceae bacterium]